MGQEKEAERVKIKMSDTIFEDYEIGLVVNRNWQRADYTQITLVGKAQEQGYVNIPVETLYKIVEDLKKSCEETKDAWWHHITE